MKFEVAASGSRYHVTTEDQGEPGRNDAITVQKVSGTGPTPPPTRQQFKSGNVQWHAGLDDDDDDDSHDLGGRQ